ncbi:MAG: hypothetical protein JXQ90_08120 [Cyclobacteriaceae bacterium]
MNKTRFNTPKRFFGRSKDRFGEMMEDSKIQRRDRNEIETDFDGIEHMRQHVRSRDNYRQLIYRVLSGIGAVVFIYFFLKLAADDLFEIFY